MARLSSVLAILVLAALSLPEAAFSLGSFVTFESGQVRPLALSPDGTRLFATNTPDNRLEIFAVDGAGIMAAGSVPVGMEPVAVAARTGSEVWVVNHLSDSISIVDVGSTPPRVVRTLLVGDEPRDIVFAGSREGGDPNGPFIHAFITTAHRGQNSPVDPQLTTEGVGGPTSGSSTRPPWARAWAGTRSRSSPSSATHRGRWRPRRMAAGSTRPSPTRGTGPRSSPRERFVTEGPAPAPATSTGCM